MREFFFKMCFWQIWPSKICFWCVFDKFDCQKYQKLLFDEPVITMFLWLLPTAVKNYPTLPATNFWFPRLIFSATYFYFPDLGLFSVTSCLVLRLLTIGRRGHAVGRSDIIMPHYQYRKSHYGDKTTLRAPYIHNVFFSILIRKIPQFHISCPFMGS